jgi:hypothetical protein
MSRQPLDIFRTVFGFEDFRADRAEITDRIWSRAGVPSSASLFGAANRVENGEKTAEK